MDLISIYKEVDELFRTHKSSFSDKFKMDISDLIKAVRKNDATQVALALNAWVNPNEEDGMGRYALPIAAENNNHLAVGLLLRKRANPNILGEDGQSPLFKAVYWENETIISLLLEEGADINFPNSDGNTPLNEAQQNRYTEIITLLTNYKTAKDRHKKAQDAATHERIREKARKVREERTAKLEKAKVAEEERQQAEQEKAAAVIAQQYAADADDPLRGLIKYIIKKDNEGVKYFMDQVSDFNQVDVFYRTTPLMLAVEMENGKLAKYLMEEGASPNLLVNGQYSPFTKAVRMQSYHLVQFMLEQMDDTAIYLNDATALWSPLFLAYKDPRLFNMLLETGADPHFGGKEGLSPIRKAIEKASIGVLPVLSRHKVDLNQLTDGKRPLEWAVEFNRADWVNGLLGERVEDEFTTSQGNSLIELATTLGDREAIVALLEEHL